MFNKELAVIDWPACLSACGNDAAIARNLLTRMIDELGHTQRILANAYANKDTQTLRDELHRCLGGVVYLKLPELEACVRAYQHTIKTKPQDPTAVKTAYAELNRAILAFEDTVTQGEFDH